MIENILPSKVIPKLFKFSILLILALSLIVSQAFAKVDFDIHHNHNLLESVFKHAHSTISDSEHVNDKIKHTDSKITKNLSLDNFDKFDRAAHDNHGHCHHTYSYLDVSAFAYINDFQNTLLSKLKFSIKFSSYNFIYLTSIDKPNWL